MADDLLREAKEDLRRERTAKLLKTYGAYALGGAVTAALIAGLYSWNKDRERKEQAQLGDQFFAVAEKEKTFGQLPVIAQPSPFKETVDPEMIARQEADLAAIEANMDMPPTEIAEDSKAVEQREEAVAAYEQIMKSGDDGYAVLAAIREAGINAELGKVNEAIATYDAIAADKSNDQAIRDLAALQAVSLLIDHPSDKSDIDKRIDSRLEDLSGDLRPWRYSARELQAFRALNKGDNKKALQLFEGLMQDPQIPEAMYERTVKVVNLLRRDQEPYDPFAAEENVDALLEAAEELENFVNTKTGTVPEAAIEPAAGE